MLFRSDFGFVAGRDEWISAAYGRYGLTEDLAAYAKVPYVQVKPDIGDSESGLGDIAAGFEFRVSQDIFDYPWVMPHAELKLDTGDEEKGLGSGTTVTTVGLAVGTTVMDVFHWVGDAAYQIHDEGENIASISGAFIWDLSDQCSVLVEGTANDLERGPGREHPKFFQGGLTYEASENLMIGFYGGSGKNTDEDVVATVKAAYSF